jgi:hypothetical protein
MRLWTLHPKYLDTAGLVALWREALLARAVLRGRTDGYRHHPQLERFRAQPRPVASLNRYLEAVYGESRRRGFTFDPGKLGRFEPGPRIAESAGQVGFEWEHLLAKLRLRSPEHFRRLLLVSRPVPHPLFRLVPGPVRGWERSAS